MLYAAEDAGDFGDVGDRGASRRWRKPGEKGSPGSTLKRNDPNHFAQKFAVPENRIMFRHFPDPGYSNRIVALWRFRTIDV